MQITAPCKSEASNVVSWTPPPARRVDPSRYLAPSAWCDSEHTLVRHLALEVTADARTAKEASVALFYWVRDEVAYTMGDWNYRASETLVMRVGTCSNKANLMVAMARSLGIPSGFHIQYVETASYFSGSFIPLVSQLLRDKAIHVYPTLRIDGRWVRCDPTDDRALSDAIAAIVPHACAFDFDGERDAVLPFADGSILSDLGPLPQIDDILLRSPRLSPATKRMFGAYVAFMRRYGARYTRDCSEERARIEADFLTELARVEPEVHAELVSSRCAA
jgi:transglutaminase superfamily protein